MKPETEQLAGWMRKYNEVSINLQYAEASIVDLVNALEDVIKICELTFGRDFRNGAADIPARLHEAKQAINKAKERMGLKSRNELIRIAIKQYVDKVNGVEQ